ncbi:MAG: hypothetical protein QMD92_00585 [bacterium]|nr:hypothetical protein [bacterium]
MEIGLRVNNIQGNEKEGIVSNLNRIETENINQINIDREEYDTGSNKEYDRIDISKKARIAYKAKEVVSQLGEEYFIDKESISRYKEVIKEGKYLLRKVSELVADKMRDRLANDNVDEFMKFPMHRKDYLAYKIANHLVS